MGCYEKSGWIVCFLPLTFKHLVQPERDDLGLFVHTMLVEEFFKNDFRTSCIFILNFWKA